MRDVHLLRARCIVVAEAGQQIGVGRLKSGKGLLVGGIVEVVIDAQVLLFIDLVVNLRGNLVGTGMVVWNSSENVLGVRKIRAIRVGVRTGHIAVQKVRGYWIETIAGNYVIWKKGCEGFAHASPRIAAGVQYVGEKLSSDRGVRVKGGGGKVARPLRCGRNDHRVGRNPVHHAAPPGGKKEEGPVFLDRPAEGAAELVLFVVGPARIEIALRIEHLVAEE